ncbi:hypothetical protein ABZ412_34105 [Nocardia sp. NPDC005746]|uniref:hypothetical protein n=1 Tax=Nocardia sp. NPDC005746 TaxID=3157062 RepID=UPI0034103F52
MVNDPGNIVPGSDFGTGNPFDRPQAPKAETINTGQLVVNGQPVRLPPHIQPVYVVQVPRDQIATAVMRGVIYAVVMLALIGFAIALLIGVVANL